MYLTLRFPGFKRKAFTLNYDDGNVFDVTMIEKMKPYGVKGTFNIDGGMFGAGRRMTLEEAKKLYEPNGMEVACHGFQHWSLGEMQGTRAAEELLEDRKTLEKEFGHLVQGLAYANGSFNDDVVSLVKNMGFHFARTCAITKNFVIPEDWLRMPTTCKHQHPELFDLAEEFIKNDTDPEHPFRACNRPRWFQVWGHSYEFNDNSEWDILDRLLDKVGGREDVFYCTTGEMYDYVHAYKELQYSADGKMIYNPTGIDIYLDIPKTGPVFVKAGELTKAE